MSGGVRSVLTRLRSGVPRSGAAAYAGAVPAAVVLPVRGGEQCTFWRRAGATVLSRSLALPLGVLASVVVARALGPAGRGTFGVMLAIGAIGVQLGNLGLPSAAVYTLGRDPGRLRSLLGLMLLLALGVGGGLGLAWGALASAGLVAVSLTRPLAWAAAAWIPIGLLYLLAQNALLGLRAIRWFNLLQLALDAGNALVLVLCFWVGWHSPARFYGASFAVTALAGVTALLVLLRRAGGRAEWPPAELVAPTLRYGARAYFATLLAYLVINFDLLMVAGLRGARDAGYYAIAGRIGEMLSLAPAAIGAMLFATVSAKREGQWAFARRVTLTLALVLPPLLLLAAVLARPVIALLFGSEFLPAVAALLWLLPGVYALSVNMQLMNYFGGTGMPPVTMVGPGVGLLANVLLNLWWIPRYGIVGAAASSSVAYGLMLVTSLVYLRGRVNP